MISYLIQTGHAGIAIAHIFGSCLRTTFNFDLLIFIVILQLVCGLLPIAAISRHPKMAQQ